MTEKREVLVSEFLEAGTEGRALLDLVAKTGEKIVTSTGKMMLLSHPDDPENGQYVDVLFAGFNSYRVSRIIPAEGVTESGYSAETRDGMGAALKKLFNYYAREGIIVAVAKENLARKKKDYFRYEQGHFEQVYRQP